MPHGTGPRPGVGSAPRVVGSRHARAILTAAHLSPAPAGLFCGSRPAVRHNSTHSTGAFIERTIQNTRRANQTLGTPEIAQASRLPQAEQQTWQRISPARASWTAPNGMHEEKSTRSKKAGITYAALPLISIRGKAMPDCFPHRFPREDACAGCSILLFSAI